MDIERFGQRLLNPFRGCIQTIRYQAAEAVTADGVHWDIYVSNDSLLEGLPDSRMPVQVSEIRYGNWTADKGLKRGSLYPSRDFYRMEEMGAVVYAHLLEVHDRLPFPNRDCYELWLLDGDGRPLALLDSRLGPADAAATAAPRWEIGNAARERFVSPALAECPAHSGRSAGQYLMDYVNGLAGDAPAARWYRREPDGRGAALDRRDALPASAFPALLLASDGHDATHRRLIEDFLAWQAPWLLLLQHLDRDTRRRLEVLARPRAAEIERQHRLYPQIVDPGQIQAARVQARLCDALATQDEAKGDDLATFYIELNPGGAV